MNKTASYFLAGLMLVALVCWQGWQEVKAQGADWLPIKHVRIKGALQNITKGEIEKVLDEHVINGFYNADIQQAQAAVKILPWVEDVLINRVWPDVINVTINEQTPQVRWGAGELLSQSGQIFKPKQMKGFGDLALLDGPVGHETKMLNALNELNISLTRQGMALAEFQINERRAWRVKLQNGIVLDVGRNQPLKKIQRFLKTVALIRKEQIADIAKVDLRYSNGYALKWKQGSAIIDWKKIAENNKT